jgi:hypothetical protein
MFLAGVLAVGQSASADIVRPVITSHMLVIGASNVQYTAQTQILSVSDAHGVFSYTPDLLTNYQVNALDGSFGGSYSLQAKFLGLGGNAPLDGLFGDVPSVIDLVITGEIPGLNITVAKGYSGTLLRADVITAELFASGSQNLAAEFDGFLTALSGDLIDAGQFHAGETLGMLSSLLSLNPQLPAGFAFRSDFGASTQSGDIGTNAIPEPVTLLSLGVMLLSGGAVGFSRCRRNGRAV